ncbi:MAG: DMT family transporter [Gemmatimonadaceae bacterium]
MLAGSVLLVLLLMRGERLLPARRLWPVTLVLAVVGGVGGYGAMFHSPLHTDAGIAAVLGNTGPLIVIVLAAAFLRERITLVKITALLVGLLGVALIAFAREVLARGSSLGIVLPLVAALSASSESVIVKGGALGEDVLRVTAWQFLGASLMLGALSLVGEAGTPITWSPTFVAALLVLAIPGSAFGTALWYWLTQRDEVGRLSLVLFLVPVLGLALGALLFGERVPPTQLLGATLIVAACVIVALGSPRRSAVRSVAIGPTHDSAKDSGQA